MKQYERTFKYLSVNKQDKQWGGYITVAGYALIPPNSAYPPREHPADHYFTWDKGRILPEYQINYITEGSGIIETRSGTYKIAPGSMLIIFPGVWHRYRPYKSIGWKEHYIGFQGDYLNRIMHNDFFNHNQPVIRLYFQEYILESFNRIITEVGMERAAYQKACLGHLLQILGNSVAIVKNKAFEGKDIEKKIKKAQVHFRDNLNKNVNVEKLASELNIGYSYFRKMFKAFTGISPIQYHLMLKINRAKELLIHTNKGNKEIAYELGFQSVYYFTRIYKKKTGITPTETRKGLKNIA